MLGGAVEKRPATYPKSDVGSRGAQELGVTGRVMLVQRFILAGAAGYSIGDA